MRALSDLVSEFDGSKNMFQQSESFMDYYHEKLILANRVPIPKVN